MAHHLVDLVVVDLNLGDGFGDELLPMIRERVAAKTYIMILTGGFERASMDHCFQLGANKPGTVEEIHRCRMNCSSRLHNRSSAIKQELCHPGREILRAASGLAAVLVPGL